MIMLMTVAEISEFDVIVLVAHEYVLELEISVEYVVGVQVFEAVDDLSQPFLE